MFRLILLTLLALFAVAAVIGNGDPDAAQSASEPEIAATPVEEAPDPQPTLIGAQAEAAETPAPEVEQTPEQVQNFPGPELRPSPEYADQIAAAEVDALATSGAEILYVTGNRVNFRAGPSTNDRVIGALRRGSPVEALGNTENGWIQLRDVEGREGYMSGQFLSADRPN